MILHIPLMTIKNMNMETNVQRSEFIKKIFAKFLKANQVDDEFKRYLGISDNSEFNKYLDEVQPIYYVSNIFWHLENDEQAIFWVKIANKWGETLGFIMESSYETFENYLIKSINNDLIFLDSVSVDGNGLMTLTIKIGRPSQELINTITSKANQFDFRSI